MLHKVLNFCKNEDVTLLYDHTGTLKSKGKYIFYNDKHYIVVRAGISEFEEVKVIMHELEHVRHGDTGFYNSLQILKIEATAKKDSVIDLISLLETEEIPSLNYVHIAQYLGIDPEYYKSTIFKALEHHLSE